MIQHGIWTTVQKPYPDKWREYGRTDMVLKLKKHLVSFFGKSVTIEASKTNSIKLIVINNLTVPKFLVILTIYLPTNRHSKFWLG